MNKETIKELNKLDTKIMMLKNEILILEGYIRSWRRECRVWNVGLVTLVILLYLIILYG